MCDYCVLRLVKTIQGFDSLYLITTSIKGSVSILLWTVVLFVLFQMILALLLQQILADYVLEDSNPDKGRAEVFMYYGTFARTMLTMFELTLGNWVIPCRALVENVSEWYMVFFLFHKMIMGFSVVSVVMGVFIQETFKVSTTDDTIMMIQKERAIRTHQQKMEALFKHADESGDGFLDTEEFENVVSDPGIQTWLAAMELDVVDAKLLFELIDDGDNQICAQELLEGVARLKGTARSIDLLTLLHEHRQNQMVLQEIRDLDLKRLFDDHREDRRLIQRMYDKLEESGGIGPADIRAAL